MTINIAHALHLYFICGTQDVVDRSLPETLQQALDAGITCFQFREKGPDSLADKEARQQMAQICLGLCRKAGVPFIMNDDVELALAIGADGVHVGQDDGNIEEILQLVPNNMLIGLSVNTFEQYQAAAMIPQLAYIGVGPVYATSSKTDAKATVGLELLQKISNQPAPLPVVAIGGITLARAPLVRATGVAGIAVISALAKSTDIPAAVSQLKNN